MVQGGSKSEQPVSHSCSSILCFYSLDNWNMNKNKVSSSFYCLDLTALMFGGNIMIFYVSNPLKPKQISLQVRQSSAHIVSPQLHHKVLQNENDFVLQKSTTWKKTLSWWSHVSLINSQINLSTEGALIHMQVINTVSTDTHSYHNRSGFCTIRSVSTLACTTGCLFFPDVSWNVESSDCKTCMCCPSVHPR